MSAWYVWSALGLYPETPGTADLAIGSPLFPEAVISGSKTTTIDAPAAADGSPYVQGLTVNGAASSLAYLPAADTLAGSTLVFTLGSSADTAWAAAAADAPPSYNGTPGTGVTQPVGPLVETATGKCVDDRGAGNVERHQDPDLHLQRHRCAVLDRGPGQHVAGPHRLHGRRGRRHGQRTLVQLHTCNGTGAQQWDQDSSGELVNPESGLCLTDPSDGERPTARNWRSPPAPKPQASYGPCRPAVSTESGPQPSFGNGQVRADRCGTRSATSPRRRPRRSRRRSRPRRHG